MSGLSSPSRRRSISMVSWVTAPPSPRSFTSTMSPGTMRNIKNTSTATPSSVGIVSRTRFMVYRSIGMAPAARLCTGPRQRSLGVQPNIAEILAEVVTRRHAPAHYGLLGRYHAVPPQPRLLVGLFEQPFLEGLDQRLALLLIEFAHLRVIELIELRILRARAVVRRTVN